MRHYICFALFVFCAITTTAQDADSSSVINMDTAAYHYGNTAKKTFQVNKEPIVYRRAFRVNTAKNAAEVYERALGYARMLNANYTGDKKRSVISIPVSWEYKGGFNECIENLNIKATLTLEVKDTKTRISLTDITYTHYDKNDAGNKPVAKTDFFTRYDDCAPASGKAELLYNCSECSRSVKNIDKNFQSQFEVYSRDYQEWLKKY